MKRFTNNRIITSIIIIFVIAAGIIYSFKYYNDFENKQRIYNNSLLSDNIHLSSNATLLLSEILLPERELVTSTAQRLQSMNLNDDNKIKEYLTNKSGGFSTVGGFFFGRNDGAHFKDRDVILPPDFNPTERPWYKKAADKKDFIVTNSYMDLTTGKPCITLAAPVYQNGTLIGVVGLDIFTDKFNKLFENLSPDHSTHYFVTDYYGNIIINHDSETNDLTLKDAIQRLTGNMDITSSVGKQDWLSILDDYNGIIDFQNSYDEKISGFYWTMPQEEWKVVVIKDPNMYSSEMKKMKKTFYSYEGIGIILLLFIILFIISINMYIERVRFKYMLTHDVLTGLPNRQYLEKFFRDEVAKTKEPIDYSLLLIDIDNFKFINDTYGHVMGDEILKAISYILKNLIPGDGLFIRSAGDEFAVLLTNVTVETAKYFTERLQTSISGKPLQVLNKNLDISISTGYTVIDNRENIMKFFSLSNAALKIAKEEGKNKAVCLLPDDLTKSIDDPDKINELISLMKNALRENRFVLFLQPIMDVDSKKVKHYEALIRLRGKDDKLISPAVFIPVAERFGLICDIDRWVFEEVLKIILKHRQTTIFMNISVLSLTNNTLLEFFEKRILECGIDSSNLNLGFEITETASTKNFIQAQNWMEKFKNLGCKIALDDFGVGYTSFSYLRSLPVDYIKIDGSFVHNIDKDVSHRAIVQTINTLAISLGKDTIAEYVETEAVLKILKEIGVKYGQGYHLGRPGPAVDKLNIQI